MVEVYCGASALRARIIRETFERICVGLWFVVIVRTRMKFGGRGDGNLLRNLKVSMSFLRNCASSLVLADHCFRSRKDVYL